MPSALTITDLHCEHRRNPLGIGEREPRLSWTLGAERRGEKQTAYRVLVASSRELLAQERGDLWDSARVTGDATRIVYGGRALVSRERCWWTVQVWDAQGQPTAWSAPAWWEMALLSPSEWSARWIGIDGKADDERLPLSRARWIRQSGEAAAGGFLQTRHRFTLPDGAIASAWLRFVGDGTGDPWNHQRPYLFVNGKSLDAWKWLWRMRTPTAWDVREQLKSGENALALMTHRNDGAAVLALLTVELVDGRIVEVASSAQWEARVVATGDGDWHASAEGWAPSRDGGAFGAGPFAAEHIYNRMDKLVPPVYLRTGFSVDKPVTRARIYATAAGVYELRLNGQRVGDHELAPGWTDYRKRLQYQTYDVTALLRQGENGLGALVADGWFSGRQFHGANVHGTEKALLCQLHLDFADGSSRVIASDESWLGGTGAIRAADIWDGEDVDERRDLHGWCGYKPIDKSAWRAVRAFAPTIGELVPQPDEPVRATAILAPRSIVEHRPGVFIVDFGQNHAGRVRLRLHAPAGTRVRLRHAEMLAKDGSIYVENLRGAKATDVYVCRGGGETYEPRLVFHGYRYCEITGLPGAPAAEDVVSVVLNSDCEWSGTFSCSDPRLMQLQSNIRWGQRSNFLSVPTDCPQRDERAGWTGDAQIFVRTALFNMDAAAFYEKYQQDMVDDQHANGAFPDVAPCPNPIDSGHFGWGDAGVVVPWTVWKVTGDTRILARHFAAMAKWVDHRTAKAAEAKYTDWNYGDWVSPPPQTPSEILNPIYHAWAARIVAECAEAIGRAADATTYRKLADEVSVAWRKTHLKADGKLSSDTQAAYVLALRAGMFLPEQRAAAARHLVAAVERAGWHLHTGFLGTGHLLPALSEIGRDDVAFRLLVSDTFPSWLYTIKHGATTMWERWDSYHAELGPQNIGNMNSYNHYAFGAVGEWMYAAIAGIDLAEPGFRRVVIRPRHGGVLTHARGDYRSPYGAVVSAWRIEDGKFHLEVTIPPSTTAEVHLPTRDAELVEESGKPAAQAEGVQLLRKSDEAAVFAVASGRYRFVATL